MKLPIDLKARWVRTDREIVWKPWHWRIGSWLVSDGIKWKQFGPIAERYEVEFWF